MKSYICHLKACLSESKPMQDTSVNQSFFWHSKSLVLCMEGHSVLNHSTLSGAEWRFGEAASSKRSGEAGEFQCPDSAHDPIPDETMILFEGESVPFIMLLQSRCHLELPRCPTFPKVFHWKIFCIAKTGLGIFSWSQYWVIGREDKDCSPNSRCHSSEGCCLKLQYCVVQKVAALLTAADEVFKENQVLNHQQKSLNTEVSFLTCFTSPCIPVFPESYNLPLAALAGSNTCSQLQFVFMAKFNESTAHPSLYAGTGPKKSDKHPCSPKLWPQIQAANIEAKGWQAQRPHCGGQDRLWTHSIPESAPFNPLLCTTQKRLLSKAEYAMLPMADCTT